MSKKNIMVQMAGHKWTLNALHQACSLADDLDAEIALVAMTPASHPSWLGTDFGYLNFGSSQAHAFAAFQETLEDYGVSYQPVIFQYVSLVEGLIQAAEHTETDFVFAQIPKSHIPLWTPFQEWRLQNELRKAGREWFRMSEKLSVLADEPVESVEGGQIFTQF